MILNQFVHSFNFYLKQVSLEVIVQQGLKSLLVEFLDYEKLVGKNIMNIKETLKSSNNHS